MKKFKVGLQLYSVREAMAEDMEATLKKVKEIGYDYVEFAGFFDKPAKEVKTLLDKYGLECVSAHNGLPFFEDMNAGIEYLKEVGAKYSAIPWYPEDKHKGNAEWDNTVESFTKLGKALKENGIQLLYHNHDFEFHKFEDKYLIDWLYETIPSDILHPEFDTCWVKYAGEDPCKYLEKFAGQVQVLHLKDFTCKEFASGPVYALIGGTEDKPKTKEETGFQFRPCGHGLQDFKTILESAEKAGTEYIIVEQDQHYDISEFEAVTLSREYLKTLGQ